MITQSETLAESSQWNQIVINEPYTLVQIYEKLRRKIVNIFLSISVNICFGAQKNRLSETVVLSTHNICFC